MRTPYTLLTITFIALCAGIVVPLGAYAIYQNVPLGEVKDALQQVRFARGGTLQDVDLLSRRVTLALVPQTKSKEAPLSVQFTDATVFIRHTPVMEDGVWVSVTSAPSSIEDITLGEYVYLEYVIDLQGMYLAKRVIVGNPLIQ